MCSDLKRKAGLVRSRGSTSVGLRVVGLFHHQVLGQPVENVCTVPANGLSAVRAPLGKSSEDCEAQQEPARATGQARDLAGAKYRAQVRKRFVDPPRQAKVLGRTSDRRGDRAVVMRRSGIHVRASSTGRDGVKNAQARRKKQRTDSGKRWTKHRPNERRDRWTFKVVR